MAGLGAMNTACRDFARRYIGSLSRERGLVHGVAWLFGGTVVARAATLAASIIVARQLGIAEFGKFGILQTTLAMFQTFAGFGLGETATKYVAELRDRDPERAGRIAGLSLVIAALSGVAFALMLCLAAPFVALHALADPALTSALRISAPMLLLGSLIGAQMGALSGLEAFRSAAMVSVWSGILTIPLLAGGAYVGGLDGAVWGLVLSYVAQWGWNQALLRRELRKARIKVRIGGCLTEHRILLRFSLPAMFGGTMVVPVYWFCATLLVHQVNGYRQMGLFNAANQWYQALLFIPTVVSQVSLPILSNRLGQGADEQAASMLRLTMRTNAVFALLVAGVLSALSPFIMTVYGHGFRDGWPVLIIVLFTGVLQAAAAPVGQYIAASGRMWIGFWMNAGWALAFVAFTLGLISRGAEGLASARLLAYALHLTWTFWYALVLQRRAAARGRRPILQPEAYP